VDAADWLRHLDVSKPLWGEACLAMGREQAAIALAVVSTKDSGAFPDDPGWVFPRHGGEGEDQGAEPRSHALRDAAGCRSKAASEDGPIRCNLRLSARTAGADGGEPP
jgi:Replication protein C C-terminal region